MQIRADRLQTAASLVKCMQPLAYTGRRKGPWRQPFIVNIHDWPAVLSLGSRQVCDVALESPRAQWPGSSLAKS